MLHGRMVVNDILRSFNGHWSIWKTFGILKYENEVVFHLKMREKFNVLGSVNTKEFGIIIE